MYNYLPRCRKSIWQSLLCLQIKVQKTLRINESYLKMMKAMYNKPIDNSLLNGRGGGGEKGEVRQRYTLLPLWLNMMLKVLARAITHEKEMKGIKIGKGKIKLALFLMTSFYVLKTLYNLPENT